MWAPVSMIVLSVLRVIALDEFIYINGDVSLQGDLLKKGKEQYQLLKERGHLPKYGPCWRQAFEYIEDGCRVLTEDTQSNVALHMTNCFLDMSGHQTYNCGSDKKPNLKAICISSMSDRAFNVYTEFYTHAQNICWYLRGQMWQEMISENTQRVTKQLAESTKNQESLLRIQQQSLQLQKKLITYGTDLDKMLGGFLITTQQHHDVIKVLTSTVSNLQFWLIGEISWVDSVLFYLLISFIILFLTSASITFRARLPLILLFTVNVILERLLLHKMNMHGSIDAREFHGTYYNYVWYMRYTFITAGVVILSIAMYNYTDYVAQNHLLLIQMKHEIGDLHRLVKINVPNRQYSREDNRFFNEYERNSSRNSISDLGGHTSIFEELKVDKSRYKRTAAADVHSRYNLRSRQHSPDQI